MENEEYPIMTVEQFADAVVEAAATPDSFSVKGNLYGIRTARWAITAYDRRLAPDAMRKAVERRLVPALRAFYVDLNPEQQALARSYGFAAV